MDGYVMLWVWEKLPLYKHIVGRKRVYRMVARAYSGLREGKADGLAASVAEPEARLGIIPMLIIGALASNIVRLLIDWMRERGER